MPWDSEAGVPEYWIVYPETRCIAVLREPRAGVYAEERVEDDRGVVRCASVPELTVGVKDVLPAV